MTSKYQDAPEWNAGNDILTLPIHRGPSAGDHVLAITILGAANTVIAGVLALIKGQGLPDRLYHDRAEFRRLQDW